jgi:hypothetical protein
VWGPGAAVVLKRHVARRRLVGFAGGMDSLQDSSSCADKFVTCSVRDCIKVARKYCIAGRC